MGATDVTDAPVRWGHLEWMAPRGRRETGDLKGKPG